ncbi:putative dna repair protein rad7 [Venturia nashicola]|uniref:Putative dna repair protein rad7 n=1 Tax=Venturia nashicola TaxID=86259 RepID=A0A4Z1PNN1_9PEZI|nr:putative dna repair protein rad7 [Venturia nashicola]TLD36530.1 putative dna repair protein rad7 [Venturia nashicola]
MSRYNTITKGTGYNINTGGYGTLTNNQLKNIALPDKLRCKRCNRWKQTDADGKENFSKKQLAAVRETIYYSGRGKQTPIEIVCSTCSPSQNNELHCVDCDTTKGLESFALAQRKNPVAAKCLVCMDEQLEFDPDVLAEQLNDLRRPPELQGTAYYDDSDDDSDNVLSYKFTPDEDDDDSNVADSSAYGDDTTESGYEGSVVTGSRQISASMDSLSISASSGGVHLSQGGSDLSAWQTVTGGRVRKAAPSSTVVNGSNSSYSASVQINKTGFSKVKAFITTPEGYTANSKQAKKAGTAKLPVKLGKDSKCANSDWDSDDEEEHGSIATTRATCATQEDLDNLQEHEITWESDDSSEQEYDSDDE